MGTTGISFQYNYFLPKFNIYFNNNNVIHICVEPNTHGEDCMQGNEDVCFCYIRLYFEEYEDIKFDEAYHGCHERLELARQVVSMKHTYGYI